MGSILVPFWRACWLQFRFRIALEHLSCSKIAFFTGSYKTQGKINIFHPKTARKSTQDGPKSASRGTFFALEFRHRFFIDFWSIWVSFWVPFGDPNGAKINQKLALGPKTAQGRPKSRPRGQKGTQKAPKRHPKGTQKAPKSTPKSTQEHQKGTQKQEETVQEPNTSDPGRPWEHFWEPFAFQKRIKSSKEKIEMIRC